MQALYELQEFASVILPVVVMVSVLFYSKLHDGRFSFRWAIVMYAASAVTLQWYIPFDRWMCGLKQSNLQS